MSLDLHVDPDKCVGCGMCVADCNTRAIELDGSSRTPRWAEDGEARCFRCQHCLAICPTGALSIMGKDAAGSASRVRGPEPSELVNLIKCRRSCRSYRREGVDKATLDKLRDMLAWVPTGVNDHRLFFGFIDDIDVMDKFRKDFLARLLQLIQSNAPGAERFGRYRERLIHGEDVIFRGAPHMVLACTPEDAPCADVDPVIALSYFELYAQSLGLGTLWCGLFLWSIRLMPEFLPRFGVPAGYVPGYAMMFGNTGLNYRRSTQPPPVLLHSMQG